MTQSMGDSRVFWVRQGISVDEVVDTVVAELVTQGIGSGGGVDQAALAATPVLVNSVNGAYPPRPATTRPVIFGDPTLPAPPLTGSTGGGGGRVPGLDVAIVASAGVGTITKADVGLGNVDNTSDATKFTNTPLTGTPTAPTAATATSTTQLANTAFVHANTALKQDLIWVEDTAPTDPVTYPLWARTFVTVTDTTPPSTPTLATPTVDSSNYVNLAWSTSTDVSGVSYYQLWRGTGAGSTPAVYQNRVNGTVYIDSNVTPSTTYTYQVKAVDAFGNVGTLSNTVSIATNAASLLNDPDLRFLILTDTALGGVADGAGVASIVPQYGSLVGALTLSQATTANQPTAFAGQLNGKKVVKHVAASLQFIGGTLPSTITAATTEFIVGRITPVSGVRLMVSGINTTPYRGIGINASNKPTANAGGTPSNVASTTTATDVWKVMAVRIDPSTGATALFDNKLTTPTTGNLSTDTTANAMNSVKVGRASGSSSSYSDMQWAALGLVERAMSDADISAAMSQLGTMFGITVAA